MGQFTQQPDTEQEINQDDPFIVINVIICIISIIVMSIGWADVSVLEKTLSTTTDSRFGEDEKSLLTDMRLLSIIHASFTTSFLICIVIIIYMTYKQFEIPREVMWIFGALVLGTIIMYIVLGSKYNLGLFGKNINTTFQNIENIVSPQEAKKLKNAKRHLKFFYEGASWLFLCFLIAVLFFAPNGRRNRR